jgi:exonuclease III
VHGFITNVYGPQSSDQKAKILDFLDWYKQEKSKKMWIIGGDFNLITTLKEKKGGHRILTLEDLRFKDFIDNNELVDLETTNGIYTWNNRRGNSSQITSRLDRFLVSEEIATSRGELVATILPSRALTIGPFACNGTIMVILTIAPSYLRSFG